MSTGINNRSLRASLLRLLALAVVSAMLLVTAAVFFYEARSYQPRVQREVSTQLEVVGLNIQSALDFSDRNAAIEALRSLDQDPRFLGAVIFNRDKQTFAEFISPRSHDFLIPELTPNDYRSLFSNDTYRAYSAIQFEQETIGYTLAFYQLPPLLQRMPQYFIMVGAVALALLLCSIILFVAVEGMIAAPLRTLAKRARQYDADAENEHSNKIANEIGQLESDFERMLKTLELREGKLQQQQIRMQLALDVAEQGIWEIDIESNDVVWDRRAYEIIGMPKAETPFKLSRFLTRLDNHESRRVVEYADKAIATGEIQTFDFHIDHPTKGLRHIQSSGRLFIDADTGHRFCRGVMRDVTERIQAEINLRASEQRTRGIIEQIPTAMATATMDGTMTLVNQRFVDVFGYPFERVRTVEAWSILAYPEPAYRKEVMDEWALRAQECIEHKSPFRPMDAWVTCADGNQRLIEFHLSVFVQEMVVSMVDLTDRKRAEDEVRHLNAALEDRVKQRTEELQIANRELESFSYSVSHDLRAPLRAISGFSNALINDYRDKLDEDGQSYVDRIMAASVRMGLLIDDLLRFSRLSRTAITRTDIDMNALVDEVWREIAESSSEEIGVPSVAVLPACHADRGLLKQVVFNLLNNAVKFSRRSKPRLIEVFAETVGGHTVYVFRDNGVGFDMQFANKLFGVFQRLHRAEEFEGTGVGLALCQRVIERHGGKIWAESIPGSGASFRFTIGDDDLTIS